MKPTRDGEGVAMNKTSEDLPYPKTTPDEPERELQTDDVVARLRHAARIAWEESRLDFDPGLAEAADTIERLRISLHAAEKRAEDAEDRCEALKAELSLVMQERYNLRNHLARAQSERDEAREALGKVVEGPLGEIVSERRRQIEQEGWSYTHDDRHRHREMAMAAACYAIGRKEVKGVNSASMWPRNWDLRFWKPTTDRRNLIKAAALIIAEIERLDRSALKDAGK